MSVFICDEDTFAVLDKFLAGFYVSNEVNFQNFFANKLTKMVRFRSRSEKLAAHVLDLTSSSLFYYCFNKYISLFLVPFEPVGIEDSNVIKDGQMTASSFKSGGNFPHYSRLNGAKMWKTILTDRSPWLQVKLNNVTKIGQIASQICLENLYAKTFTMSFSMDGITWSTYREDFTQRVMFVLNLVLGQDGRQIQNGGSKRHCGGRGQNVKPRAMIEV